VSEMIEFVAQAIADNLYGDDETWRNAAVAAIKAMRNPTDEMLACGEQWGPPSDPMGLKRWQEMIDTALEGK
jgi:hypothetical protein